MIDGKRCKIFPISNYSNIKGYYIACKFSVFISTRVENSVFVQIYFLESPSRKTAGPSQYLLNSCLFPLISYFFQICFLKTKPCIQFILEPAATVALSFIWSNQNSLAEEGKNRIHQHVLYPPYKPRPVKPHLPDSLRQKLPKYL